MPDSIPPQGSSKLTAETVWSDGSRKDVTGSVSWTVSQAVTGGQMGYVSAGMFYSSGSVGIASVKGIYSSGEETFEGTITIQVTSLETPK